MNSRLEAVTRAGRAGEGMANAIIEAVHLMYQNKTALAYLRVLEIKMRCEIERREEGEKRKECNPGDHEFFKCQVPAGDSCEPIYHEVCRICRFDKNKGMQMPDRIWNGWAIQQLKEKSWRLMVNGTKE